MLVGAVAAAAVIGTVWSSRPIALDSPPSRDFSLPPSASNTSSKKLAPKPEKSQQEPAPTPAPSESEPAEGAVKSEEGADENEDSSGDSGGGAFNPETGEINWDCPCLGGMAHGPCGPEFREAFSCFVHSEDEPKGINCVEKFQGMQTCFREHPEIYASEIADDEEAEAAEREGAQSGDKEDASPGIENDKDSTSDIAAEPASPSAPVPKPSEEHPSSH
ncbi:hypothetical protein B0H17DRAFT_1194339 [Mycena rosella]|uniref:Mitochondrial intermembrane space import and assembly protein 40 n=1 Tax=Mycena rosella TaxID=1033263 RepID=A0AAD7E0F7_MYCRO|nr:hypothetical protein B0H17DRAFT_1194339 [Mycena rosella]